MAGLPQGAKKTDNELERRVKISVDNLEPTKVKLSITVDDDEFSKYFDAARDQIAKQTNLPGFRKGHVPGKLIEQRFGYAAIAGEAVNDAVPELYNKAIEEQKLHPMDQPSLNVETIPDSASSATPLAFTAEVEVRPAFELPDLSGLTVEIPAAEVTDEDIAARLERMRKSYATLKPVDRPAAKDDFVNIDLKATIDGEEVDSQEGVSYQIGSGTLLDGIDEALDGLSAGEKTTFEGTLEAGDHAGEKAQVEVTVNDVKVEELPELDDEFAVEASEYETLDELKEQLRKDLADTARAHQATEARDAFLAKLTEGIDLPVPAGVKAKTVEQNLSTEVADPSKATDEQRKDAEEEADKQLRDQMLLDTLAEELKVAVSQSDVINFLASIAQQYGMDPSYFINSVANNGQLPSVVGEVARTKGLLAAMRQVNFVHDGESVDLSDFLGEEEAQVTEEAQADEAEAVKAAEEAAKVAAQVAQEAQDGEAAEADAE